MGSEIKLNFKCPVCGTAKKDLILLRQVVNEYNQAMGQHPNDVDQWGLLEKMVAEANKEE